MLYELQNLCKYKKIREKQDRFRFIYINICVEFYNYLKELIKLSFFQFFIFEGSFWGFVVFLDDRIYKYIKFNVFFFFVVRVI